MGNNLDAMLLLLCGDVELNPGPLARKLDHFRIVI